MLERNFIEISAAAFRNRAKDAAKRAVELIGEGAYTAAADAIVDAVRYDGIAKEYEFIIEAEEWL